ncbi:MAG TPA: ABC-F family ATP-binding cassette domain-containing protein [Chthoniobacterales bacterium]|jgi:ATP-binding cassette, subfamily F, member 3|nr:ABC-F family ATP-binding cassette domain-containing protein [Chthoniobacterales bacterium]
MLTVSRLSKSFGGRILFEDAALQVNRGERIALIGPNGAGKTTLFSILLGLDEADSGEVALQRGLKVGYLPQESAPVDDETVLEVATALLRDPAANNQDQLSKEESFSSDHQQIEAKAKRILRGLGFRETDYARQAKTMSGGWIMRAHLGRLLVTEPDLLLLDEPTNHLDLESLVWLQNYLSTYSGAILLISHDRSFLNAVADRMVEIDQRKLISYRGNYDEYLTQKAARQEQHLAAYKNQQREISRLQTFIDRFGAKNTKASQAQSKRKQIERMDKIEAPDSAGRRVAFQFPQPERSGRKVLELKGVDHAYGETVVYQSLDYTVERNQRTVLVGPNGAGKSTLLKLLAGVLPIQSGSRELGHNVQVGYCSQHRVDTLNLDHTVLQEASDCGQQVSEQVVRTLLGAFLFRGDEVFKPVSVLSGGEKSRLVLAKLLLNPPNFLLMDEPTTHLDMPSIEALIQSLQQYEGTLVFISHDVYFIKSIATSVLHVRGGALTPYPGNYDYYLEKTGTESAVAGLVAEGKSTETGAGAGSARKGREQKRLEADARQKRSEVKQELQQELRTLEEKILRLELRQKELTSFLEQPDRSENSVRPAQVGRELASVTQELKTLSLRWERLVDTVQEV